MPQTAETMRRTLDYADSMPDVARPVIVGFSTPLNSYGYPDKRAADAHGHAVMYLGAQEQDTRLAVWRTDLGDPASRAVRTAHRAVYLIDDGSTVSPYYVSGHSPDTDPALMFLHRFPVNQRTARWAHNPARAYHLTLGWIPALADWHRAKHGADGPGVRPFHVTPLARTA